MLDTTKKLELGKEIFKRAASGAGAAAYSYYIATPLAAWLYENTMTNGVPPGPIMVAGGLGIIVTAAPAISLAAR